MHKDHFDAFSRYLTSNFHGAMELIDNPIVANMKVTKQQRGISNAIMENYQSHLIERIEIKGMHKKNTLFNCRECLLTIDIGVKRMANLTLQLFYYSHKKESYNYELAIPLVIMPLQAYNISMSGVEGNIIIILHGKRARPLQ